MPRRTCPTLFANDVKRQAPNTVAKWPRRVAELYQKPQGLTFDERCELGQWLSTKDLDYAYWARKEEPACMALGLATKNASGRYQCSKEKLPKAQLLKLFATPEYDD